MANNVDIFFTHKVTCKINIFSECQTTEWVQPNPPDRTVGRGQGAGGGGVGVSADTLPGCWNKASI